MKSEKEIREEIERILAYGKKWPCVPKRSSGNAN